MLKLVTSSMFEAPLPSIGNYLIRVFLAHAYVSHVNGVPETRSPPRVTSHVHPQIRFKTPGCVPFTHPHDSNKSISIHGSRVLPHPPPPTPPRPSPSLRTSKSAVVLPSRACTLKRATRAARRIDCLRAHV